MLADAICDCIRRDGVQRQLAGPGDGLQHPPRADQRVRRTDRRADLDGLRVLAAGADANDCHPRAAGKAEAGTQGADGLRKRASRLLRGAADDEQARSRAPGRGGLFLKAAGRAAVFGDEPARAGPMQHGLVHLPGERALQGKNMGRAEPRRAAGLQRSGQRQHARPAARGKVRQSGKFR